MLKLNVIKLADVASKKITISEATYQCLSLKPQLAFDPKLVSASELYNYAREQWKYYDADGPLGYAEEKVDGVRCQFVLGLANGKPTAVAYSRANRELASVGHLIEDLVLSRDNFIESNNDLATEPLAKWLANRAEHGYPKLVIDCELFAVDNACSYLPFRLINGFANRRQPDADTSRLQAYVFQIYWANERGNCICTVDPSLWELMLYSQLRLDKTHWVAASRYEINSEEDLVKLSNDLASRHAEGIVFKCPDSRHFDGRSKRWLKLKFRKRGTFRLTEVIAGEGKCLGNAGAIRVTDSSGNSSLVGTGFTDSDRAELSSLDLSARPVFVDVSYMTKTGDSLREASFEGIRYDLPEDYLANDVFMTR